MNAGDRGKRVYVLAGVLAVLVALGGGWVAYSELSAHFVDARAAARARAAPTLVAAQPPAALVLGAGLRETAERLDAPYQLGVDRRFRIAKSVLLGGAVVPAEWKQSFGGDDPWSAERPFPRPLGFEGAFQELTRLAPPPSEAAQRAIVMEDPGDWLAAPVVAFDIIARETQASPRPHDPLAAARAAISLLHDGVDRLAVADELGGFALAWLVLAEQARGEERTVERAVLALELGYTETASKLGQKLADGPWKARLTFDDRALAADKRGQWLWYQRQSELSRAEERASWDKLRGSKRFGWAGLSASLRSNHFETLGRSSLLCAIPLELQLAARAGADVEAFIEKLEDARSPEAIQKAFLDAHNQLLGQGLRHLGVSLDALSVLGRLDLWIQKGSERLRSPTARIVFEKYAESLVASCFGAFVEYRFDRQGITPEDRVNMGRLIFESKRPLFAQMKAWAELRAEAAASTIKSGQVTATMRTLDRLGAPAKAGLFGDLVENIEFSSAEDAAAMQMLAESLDTRPDGLRLAARNLAVVSRDLRYKDFFWGAWVREAASTDPVVLDWWQRYIEGSDGVPASEMPLRESELRKHLDPSIDDWEWRQELTTLLREHGREAEIPAVVERWLETHRKVGGFGRQWALTTLAGVKLRAGHADEAWKIWEPLQDSYKLSTIKMGVQIALARGDSAAAEELSTRALTRYPASADALGLRLRVLWTTGRPDAARDVVRSLSRLPTLSDLDPVRDAFVEIYSTKPPDEARAAAARLLDSSLTRSFVEVLADHFRHTKQFAHCVATFEVPSDSPLHQLQNDVWAYRCRKETMGGEQALAWLGSRVPLELRAPMVMFAYHQRVPELLWELPQPTESQPSADTDYLWAMRAASQLQTGEPIDPRVTEHFRKETRMDSYAAIGRYLTGFIDEKTVLTAATNSRHANEVAYFLGLKAAHDGRIADAIVWYRASVETREVTSLEFDLAKKDLYRYYASGRSLRSFAAGSSP